MKRPSMKWYADKYDDPEIIRPHANDNDPRANDRVAVRMVAHNGGFSGASGYRPVSLARVTSIDGNYNAPIKDAA